MVKVREGEESLPAPTPTVTLTPTAPLNEPPHTEPIAAPLPPPPSSSSSMGVPPSPVSSLSASGPVSPASSVNSTGEDPPPYHRPHHHHSNNNNNDYNYYNYQPWGRGGGGSSTAGRRYSPHHHHHHHHYHHYQNGSSPGPNAHHFNHHQNGSSGGVGSSHHNSNHHYSHNHNLSNGSRNHYPYEGYYSPKSSYQNSYQGYQSGYHGGYSGKGRHKYSRDEAWVGCLSMGGGGVRGRGGIGGGGVGGGRYKAISPTPVAARSRGTSPRSRNSQSFSATVSPPEDTLGTITVEMGGSGGLVGGGGTLVGGLEEGFSMGPGEEGQHVVHLHINPGTTVNFTMEDGHVQRISGPASVRMVSNNSSPPIPLPLQVPQGHVVQQIVDETGTLRHVILSAQPVPMPICPYGPNAGQGPPQFYGHPPPGPPPQGYGPPYQTPTQYSPVMSPPLTQSSPPPAYPLRSDRQPRHYEKGRNKVYQRQPQQPNKSGSSSLHSTPPMSPKKEPVVCKNGSEEIMTEDGDDTSNSLHHLLSQVKPPKVLEVTPYKAIIQWSAPDLSGLREEVAVLDLHYDVFLNNGSYTTTRDTQLTICELTPATEYRVYLQCLCGEVKGDASSVTTFQSHSTVPDAPQIPRLINKTKTSLQYRWGAVKDNGSRVTTFVMELCGGNNSDWAEVFRGRGKQCTVSKLQPNTSYRVRLAAVNEHGRGDFSMDSIAHTSGVVPSQPQPPSLDQASVSSLSLGWVKRPEDENFTLQMEDSLNGYGFRPIYNGRDTKYICQGLRRNADYKFRLCSHNDEGTSQFSDITCYRTLPDRPKPPPCVDVKGRPKATRFTAYWTQPTDHGGSPVTSYRVEIDRGSGFECIYTGDALETDCTDLKPGTSYRVRVLSMSLGGLSDWSDTVVITTDAICPGQCQPPWLLGKPKASVLQLKWGPPDYDGGATVTEYHIDMKAPDNDRRQVYCGRDLECTVASLLPGRPYIFLVRGVNRIGPGPWSEPLEAVSGAGPPDAPHAPHLACRGPHSVHLAWEEPINNGAGIEQYIVQVAEVSCLHAESSESSSTCGDPESELTFSTAYTGSATTTEVRNLAPATTYAFRVSCSNSAGGGPWSSHATVTTPAAPPAPVAYISSSAAATSVTLLWGEPANHGDPISQYAIEIGDRTVTTLGPETEFTLDDLLPETLYKIRIQAINSVGPGGFGNYHKVSTRPLPPTPPNIELVRASYNSLRLKWGDGRNVDILTYSLQMEFLNPHTGTREFYQVYSGTNQNFKLVRLEENTEYHLRICASNEAGVGPYSPVIQLSTTKAPPPPPKAPRVTEGVEGFQLVEWCGVRCPGEDPILYRLQVAVKDQDYSLVYTGSETSYALTDLEPQTGYYVRVCGVRICGDGETMAGSYSSPTLFNTPKPLPVVTTKTAVNPTQEAGLQWHKLSDQQKAFVILAIFSLFCAIAAIGLHHFLTHGTDS